MKNQKKKKKKRLFFGSSVANGYPANATDPCKATDNGARHEVSR